MEQLASASLAFRESECFAVFVRSTHFAATRHAGTLCERMIWRASKFGIRRVRNDTTARSSEHSHIARCELHRHEHVRFNETAATQHKQ
jgi:hypothetical protein